MKQTIIALILTVVIQTGNCQVFKYIKPNLTDSTKIIRTKIDTAFQYEQLVYIDYKKISELKKEMTNFNAIYENGKYFISKTYYDALKNEKSKPQKEKISLPEKWIKLNQYKGNWILYNDIPKYILNDSCLITFSMDDPNSSVIKKFNFENNIYHFELFCYNWENPTTNNYFSLEIKILDSKKMITLWTEKYKGRTEYQIMIPASKSIDFPIMGILTNEWTGDESDLFDKIDYKQYE
jgi:hypothetical protein